MATLMKIFVHLLFSLKSKDEVTFEIIQYLEEYIVLENSFKEDSALKQIKVPKMLGIDEDMRDWSFYMLLSHNTIVNLNITKIITSLALNETIKEEDTIDIKKDVMPSFDVSRKELLDFEESVRRHILSVSRFETLKGTKEFPHPIFGNFNAHKWNCMFAFHLKLHLKQARYLAKNC